MAENSKIEWTHDTFNPWRGCHCYAETLSKRNPATLGTWGADGTRVVATEAYWRKPLIWNKVAKEAGVRRRVFCASLADVFEAWDGPMINADGERLCISRTADFSNQRYAAQTRGEPDERWVTMSDVRQRLFDLIASTPHLDWLLLTKRPENAATMLPWHAGGVVLKNKTEVPAHLIDAAPSLPNIWLGTTVENQKAADERIPILLSIPAAVRFLSVEPLLEQVILHKYFAQCECGHGHGFTACPNTGGVAQTCHICVCSKVRPRLHWVIVGGESGVDSRPMKREWALSIRDQCQAAGVAFFFKQWGDLISCWNEDAPDEVIRQIDASVNLAGYDGPEFFRVGKKNAGRLLGSREWDQFPKGAS